MYLLFLKVKLFTDAMEGLPGGWKVKLMICIDGQHYDSEDWKFLKLCLRAGG